MKVIWRMGSATVRDVYEELRAERTIAYTTVMTMMRILEDQGISHEELGGPGVRVHAGQAAPAGRRRDGPRFRGSLSSTVRPDRCSFTWRKTTGSPTSSAARSRNREGPGGLMASLTIANLLAYVVQVSSSREPPPRAWPSSGSAIPNALLAWRALLCSRWCCHWCSHGTPRL